MNKTQQTNNNLVIFVMQVKSFVYLDGNRGSKSLIIFSIIYY
jgi:hypothetical protein